MLWCDATLKAAVVDRAATSTGSSLASRSWGQRREDPADPRAHRPRRRHGGTGAPSVAAGRGPRAEDSFWIEALPQQSKMFGFPAGGNFHPDRWLVDGDVVSIRRKTWMYCIVLAIRPDALFFSAARLAVVGDVFCRFDWSHRFPAGNHAALVNSIRHKLWPLGKDVSFIPRPRAYVEFRRGTKAIPYVGTSHDAWQFLCAWVVVNWRA